MFAFELRLVRNASLALLAMLPGLTLAAEAPPAAPPPAAQAAPPPPPRAGTAFRLALTYTRVLTEDGDLTSNAFSTNALGLQFVSPSSTYVRNHFAIGHQWESVGTYRARGFRIDLVSFGYPIRLVDGPDVRL